MRFYDDRMKLSTGETALVITSMLIGIFLAFYTFGASFVVTSIILYIYYRLEKRKEKRMRSLAQEYHTRLAREMDRLASYKSFDTYMTGRDSKSFLQFFRSMVSELKRLPEKYWDLWSPIIEWARQSLEFVDGYNPRYFDVQKERHASFFDGTLYHGGKGFNDEQVGAILTNDYNNLIIAGPGAGKTSVLTARVAFFVLYQNIQQERILALAFSKSAEEEVSQRLRDQYGIDQVDTMTFHSLGFRILKQAGKVRGRNVVESNSERVVKGIVDKLVEDDEAFERTYVGYLAKWKSEEKKTKEDQDINDERLQQKMSELHVTIDGTQVRSVAERDIANYFIQHGITYEYEKAVDWCDKDEKDPHRTYSPDFYLPKHDVYIEHWAVTSTNQPPSFFSETQAAKYLKEMEWKREQFAKHLKTLWETNHTMFSEGTLIKQIEQKLKEIGVEPTRITYEELLRKAGLAKEECGVVTEAICNAVKAAKIYGLDSAGLAERARTVDSSNIAESEEARFVLDLVISAFERYEQYLRDEAKIDFEDMINQAVEVLESRGSAQGAPSVYQYDMVLVDEFQDISYQRLRLLAALQKQNPDCRLFCVGDDWQAIYGFAGSSAHYMIHFHKWFPDPVRVYLTQNYRNPSETLVFASEVIERCSQKLTKTLVARRKHEDRAEQPPLLFKRISAGTELGFRSGQNDDAQGAIQGLLNGGAEPSEVLVLSRFNFGYSQLRQDCKDSGIPVEVGKENDMIRKGVRFMSIHKSKGLEADFVILLNTFDGLFGFPPKIGSRLSFRFINRDLPDRLDEERRLFFVGSTRAKKQCVVYTWRSRESELLTNTKRYAAHFPTRCTNRMAGCIVQETREAYMIRADLSPSFKPVFWVPKSVTKILMWGDDGEPSAFEFDRWWYEREGGKIFEGD